MTKARWIEAERFWQRAVWLPQASVVKVLEAIKLVMENRERISALAAVEIARNCCGSLSYFSSVCEEEVW